MLLVKDQDVDIFEVNLVELTDSYLKIIETLKKDDLDLAAQYLVIAATLLQLKAKILLDNPKETKEVKEEKEVLLNQLVEHQRFKQVASILRTKESQRRHIFIKEHEDVDDFIMPIDGSKLDGLSNANVLVKNLEKMFERIYAQKFRQTNIKAFNFSPKERRLEILKILSKNSTPSFRDIFQVPSINHFVVTVITILDMVIKGEILIHQNEQFDMINFEKGIIHEQ